MAQPNPTEQEKQAAFASNLQRVSTRGAQLVMYASALGAIALIPGSQAPLEFVAAGLGVNLLSAIIERVAHGESIPDNNLQQEVGAAIQASKIDQLLTKDDFSRALAKLLRKQDRILTATKGNEHELKVISDQLAELVNLFVGSPSKGYLVCLLLRQEYHHIKKCRSYIVGDSGLAVL